MEKDDLLLFGFLGLVGFLAYQIVQGQDEDGDIQPNPEFPEGDCFNWEDSSLGTPALLMAKFCWPCVAALGSSYCPTPQGIRQIMDSVQSYVSPAARQYNFDEKFISSIIFRESTGDHTKINSSSGAIGLMQVLPSTARALGFDPDLLYGNPVLQVQAGVSYLDYLRGKYGNDMYKLSYSYHAGKYPKPEPVNTKADSYAKSIVNIYNLVDGGLFTSNLSDLT